MTTFGWVRAAAAGLSIVTFAFFFIHDTARWDNIFFVPDLLLCGVLIVGAAIPRRLAVPVLMIAFGAAAGIFSVSVASYAVRGEFGAASFAGILFSVAMVVVLTRFITVREVM